MHFPIEIDVAMGRLHRLDTRLILLNLTITLMTRALYAPSTWMLISHPTNPRLSILRISYDYLPDMIKEFPTSFTMEKLLHGLVITDGENTED